MSPFISEALGLRSFKNRYDYDFETGAVFCRKTGNPIKPVYRPNFNAYYFGKLEAGVAVVYLMTGGIVYDLVYKNGKKNDLRLANLSYSNWMKDLGYER